MKALKLMPLMALLLVACNKDDVECLDTKEVIIQIINPSYLICTEDTETNGNIHFNHSWDTTYSGILTECEAQFQVNLLEDEWEKRIDDFSSRENPEDNAYAEYYRQYPAEYNIIDL